MTPRKVLTVVTLALVMAGLLAQEAAACRIVPTPMPIVRPPMPRPRPKRKPLETRSHTADIHIKGPVAQVAVDAVFYNPNPYVMEGTYFFPLAADAAVDNFEMEINGKMVKAELLDADKARGIYESIVRKMKDPGLLEFVGTKMLKCRVYPMNPNSETKVKLDYTVAVNAQGGLYEFTYPYRSAKPEAGTIRSVALKVTIDQPQGIKTVYSPTHSVDVKRDGDNKATLGFEVAKTVPQRDFKLYFGVSEKDIGLSALTHKPAGEDGYFLLAVAPTVEPKEQKAQPKSVVFVMDTSGSMAGEKIRQAQGALRYCVNSLKEQDSFNIIPFATEPRAFRDKMVAATKENVKAALEFIKGMEARGGTAINAALAEALRTIQDAKGLPMVCFLTDGLPTIGETDVKTILKNVGGANEKTEARVFPFGVGYDVNTDLLDQLAEGNRGSSDYVTPKEDIEIKVSAFFQKVANPVLSDVALDFPGLKVHDVYPKQLPDLFRGTQLMVLGRYEGKGQKAIKLTGKVGEDKREFVYETAFEETKENAFLPRLWATRKVAYLLDSIRKHGKDQELVDEVVRLGKRYGIMTPYTSFLVVEDSARPQIAHRMRRAEEALERQKEGRGAVDMARSLGAAKNAGRLPAYRGTPQAAKPKPGGAARPMAEAEPAAPMIGLDAEAEKAVQEVAAGKVVNIADKTFYRRDGILYDSLYDEAKHEDHIVEVKAFSDAYFKLLKEHPGIGRYLAEGKPMVLVLDDDHVYKITQAD
jgi:Ca-activated chloride channel family protein